MTVQYTVEVKGLKEIIQRLDDMPATVRNVSRKHLRKAMIDTERPARSLAPIDTGRLRNSITSDVRGIGGDMVGAIGSNVLYAPYMEFGTGRFADGPMKGKGRHWPPGEALAGWAKRHGIFPDAPLWGGIIVAWYIGRRGGLRPRRFLRGGVEKNIRRIQIFLNQIPRDLAKFVRGN
jgi:HK97 gp10 family phage protein